jgi:tripartite-type tricarboxylate transporter receptor subunit TctC
MGLVQIRSLLRQKLKEPKSEEKFLKSKKRGGIKMKKLLKLFGVGLLLTTIFGVDLALAQESYPNRPITMVVWSTAGMGDTVTRVLCKNAEKELGQSIIIETKPGAAGAIGINHVVQSKPDGYTLGMAVTSNYIVNPHIRKLSYDTLTSITDILAVCKYNFGFAVKADSPWNTFEDIIAYARKNPGKFTYACAGVGVTQHICMERMAMKDGIKWTVVPFKSGGESVMACLGGHTDSVVQGSIDVVPHIKAGKLKMLLSVDGSKWPDAPNVPTILEKGYGFSAMSYISYLGPKGIPDPIRQKLEDAFKKAMEDRSFEEVMKQFNVQSTFMSGKEYSTLWRSQYDEMGKVVKTLGLVEK